jgi:hypothetical protein
LDEVDKAPKQSEKEKPLLPAVDLSGLLEALLTQLKQSKKIFKINALPPHADLKSI